MGAQFVFELSFLVQMCFELGARRLMKTVCSYVFKHSQFSVLLILVWIGLVVRYSTTSMEGLSKCVTIITGAVTFFLLIFLIFYWLRMRKIWYTAPFGVCVVLVPVVDVLFYFTSYCRIFYLFNLVLFVLIVLLTPQIAYPFKKEIKENGFFRVMLIPYHLYSIEHPARLLRSEMINTLIEPLTDYNKEKVRSFIFEGNINRVIRYDSGTLDESEKYLELDSWKARKFIVRHLRALGNDTLMNLNLVLDRKNMMQVGWVLTVIATGASIFRNAIFLAFIFGFALFMFYKENEDVRESRLVIKSLVKEAMDSKEVK